MWKVARGRVTWSPVQEGSISLALDRGAEASLETVAVSRARNAEPESDLSGCDAKRGEVGENLGETPFGLQSDL